MLGVGVDLDFWRSDQLEEGSVFFFFTHLESFCLSLHIWVLTVKGNESEVPLEFIHNRFEDLFSHLLGPIQGGVKHV